MRFGQTSEFTESQEARIAQLVNARLKSTRHENSDHLERALLVSKLKPKGVAGGVLVDTGTDVVWLDPASADGSVITSDTSQTGGVKWKPSGVVQRATLTTYGPAAPGANRNTGSLGSVTGTGDNVNKMLLRAYVSHMVHAATGQMGLQLWDGTPDTGAAGALNTNEEAYTYMDCTAALYEGGLVIEWEVPAYSGSKTFHVTGWSGQAGNMTIQSPARAASYIELRWL